jgi:hypothetical protein
LIAPAYEQAAKERMREHGKEAGRGRPKGDHFYETSLWCGESRRGHCFSPLG